MGGGEGGSGVNSTDGAGKDLYRLGTLSLGFSWFPSSAWLAEGFQEGMLLVTTPMPAITAPQLHACAHQDSPPEVFRGGHPPAQVHPLLKLVHGALALGNLVGVGTWG